MEKIPERQPAVKSAARTPAGDAFSALAVQLFRAHGHLVAAGDALARPAGQSTARWQVLAAIEHGPASVAQIARAMALTRQSVQRVADLLAGDGLAVYQENPAHRRAKLLAITPHGRDGLALIQAGQRVWANAIGAEVGEAELRRAGEVLAAVLAAIAKHPPGASPTARRAPAKVAGGRATV
jgi:DNA-binding MarR family transcriptional regulator